MQSSRQFEVRPDGSGSPLSDKTVYDAFLGEPVSGLFCEFLPEMHLIELVQPQKTKIIHTKTYFFTLTSLN